MNPEALAVVQAHPTRRLGQTRAADASTSSAVGSSLSDLHDLWFASWGIALAALTIAGEAGTLLPSDVAAHRAVIATERQVVTRQLALF